MPEWIRLRRWKGSITPLFDWEASINIHARWMLFVLFDVLSPARQQQEEARFVFIILHSSHTLFDLCKEKRTTKQTHSREPFRDKFFLLLRAPPRPRRSRKNRRLKRNENKVLWLLCSKYSQCLAEWRSLQSIFVTSANFFSSLASLPCCCWLPLLRLLPGRIFHSFSQPSRSSSLFFLLL